MNEHESSEQSDSERRAMREQQAAMAVARVLELVEHSSAPLSAETIARAAIDYYSWAARQPDERC